MCSLMSSCAAMTESLVRGEDFLGSAMLTNGAVKVIELREVLLFL